MKEAAYSQECQRRCPELQSCVIEFVLRQSIDNESITLDEVLQSRIEAGTLPPSCDKGPIIRALSAVPSRTRHNDEIVHTSVLRQDVWGDPVAVRCRQQGQVGGGNISPALAECNTFINQREQ